MTKVFGPHLDPLGGKEIVYNVGLGLRGKRPWPNGQALKTPGEPSLAGLRGVALLRGSEIGKSWRRGLGSAGGDPQKERGRNTRRRSGPVTISRLYSRFFGLRIALNA
jgi:hypothetical protein